MQKDKQVWKKCQNLRIIGAFPANFKPKLSCTIKRHNVKTPQFLYINTIGSNQLKIFCTKNFSCLFADLQVPQSYRRATDTGLGPQGKQHHGV